MMGQQVTCVTRPPTTLTELCEKVEQVWNYISQDRIHNLYDRLDARVSAYIAARGGYTSY